MHSILAETALLFILSVDNEFRTNEYWPEYTRRMIRLLLRKLFVYLVFWIVKKLYPKSTLRWKVVAHMISFVQSANQF